MATNYAEAVKVGTMAATRLHLQLKNEEIVTRSGGNIDVFAAILELKLPLLFRPLNGLLGAFLPRPMPGLLVTTERSLNIQRFTAAHELGHYYLQHAPSLDDENVLRRMAISDHSPNFQETEADAFAVSFIMPRWLIAWHCKQQNWKFKDLEQPLITYQLSLRLGTSYEATSRTLERYKMISPPAGAQLRSVKPKQIKQTLLGDFEPDDYRGDVWVLTEKDAELQISGSPNDHFILRLKEHGNGGYLWNAEELLKSGFVVAKDECTTTDDDGIGGAFTRSILARPAQPGVETLTLSEERPWQPIPPLSQLVIHCDMAGAEVTGFSRVERKLRTKAA